MRLTLGTAAVAALFAAATPAAAQTVVTSTADAQARGVVLTAQSLTKEADLDFGVITVDPASTGGTVTVAATALGTQGVTGGVSALSGASQAAKFVGLGAPGQSVALTLDPPAAGVLDDGNGHTIDILSMDVDSNGLTRSADGTGKFIVYVGGEFDIAPDQAAGLYSADFALTAEYQ